MKKLITIILVATIGLTACNGSKDIIIGRYRYFGGNQWKVDKRKAYKEAHRTDKTFVKNH